MRNLFNLFRCVLCGAKSQPGFDVCSVCENALPWLEDIVCCRCCAINNVVEDRLCGVCLQNPPAFDRVIAAVAYDEAVAHILQRLKFQQQLCHSRIAGKLLSKAISRKYSECHHHTEKPRFRRIGCGNLDRQFPQVIVPVPLHWKRQLKRGFNQSIEIARFVSRHFHIPIHHDLVVRQKSTQAQSSLRGDKRVKNVARAFDVRGKVVPARVAILDDVITTGATLNALARVLKQRGVQTVEVWVVARTLRKI